MEPARPQAFRLPSFTPWTAGLSLALTVWFLILCFFPDPRPLSAPGLMIRAIQSLSGWSEPNSRVVASVIFRGIAFGLLGVLATSALAHLKLRVAIPLGMALAVFLAILSQWVNYGGFPVVMQWKVSVPCALAGAFLGLATRKLGVAVIGFLALGFGLFFWGTSTRMNQDLEDSARLMVQHILSRMEEIRPGDEGFADAVRVAFAYAEDNSHRDDPVLFNKATILALGIIFGDENVAKIARKELDPQWQEPIATLRRQMTLRGRGDTPRHFWVSAALVALMDETRANTIGMNKELMDSFPGGSGFSFVDLAANRAGILFALGAIRSVPDAKSTQQFILWNALTADDFCPEIEDLPEGIARDRFQSEFGGLAGARTRELLAIIDRRMATKPVLQ